MSDDDENLESLESRPVCEMGADMRPSTVVLLFVNILLLLDVSSLPITLTPPPTLVLALAQCLSSDVDDGDNVNGTPICTVFDLFTTTLELCDFLLLPRDDFSPEPAAAALVSFVVDFDPDVVVESA